MGLTRTKFWGAASVIVPDEEYRGIIDEQDMVRLPERIGRIAQIY